MNAGSGFWHEERVLVTDPYLRMLQIFVRPHTANLKPGIQFGEIPHIVPNEWRYLFGPEHSDAPFYVRNGVQFRDIRLSKGACVAFPAPPVGWDRYFYVFTGSVTVDGETFAEGEAGLIKGSESLSLQAASAAVVVCFSINSQAPLVRVGTVGR